MKRRDVVEEMSKLNLEQREMVQKRRIDERSFDLSEGKKLVDKDQCDIDLERQLVAFKKQMFASELLSTWQRQTKYKKNMKVVEEEC